MIKFFDKLDKVNLTLDADEYTNHVEETFQGMFKHQDLTDITLICDDKKQLKAHKIILSSWSPVFKSIIAPHPSFGASAYLRGVKKIIKQETKSGDYEKVNVEFICKHCHNVGKDHSKLNRHMKSVHSNERFTCTFCDKILSRKDKLTEHMRRMHSYLNSI